MLFSAFYPDDGSEFDSWLPVIAEDEEDAAQKTLALFEKHSRSPSFIRLRKGRAEANEMTMIYFIHRAPEGTVIDKVV